MFHYWKSRLFEKQTSAPEFRVEFLKCSPYEYNMIYKYLSLKNIVAILTSIFDNILCGQGRNLKNIMVEFSERKFSHQFFAGVNGLFPISKKYGHLENLEGEIENQAFPPKVLGILNMLCNPEFREKETRILLP